MQSIRQLTVPELGDLMRICNEYDRPIDYVIRVLSSDHKYEWVLNTGVSVTIDNHISVMIFHFLK